VSGSKGLVYEPVSRGWCAGERASGLLWVGRGLKLGFVDAPEVRYARSGDVSIAYSVFGQGEVTLVYTPSFASHVELIWEEPLAARFFARLASFSRVILLDKRGTGLSDSVPLSALPTLEQRMDDLRAVLDREKIEHAALFGGSEGGPMSLLFAATYPERTDALVLWATYPRAIKDADFPQGIVPAEEAEDDIKRLRALWEEGNFAVVWEAWAEGLSPAEERRVKRWLARFLRSGLSPGAVEALLRMDNASDVRPVLSSIQAPTLCLVRARDENAPATRYLAEHIMGARYVELPGMAHLPFLGDQEPVLQETQEFLTGVRPTPEPNRVLATVLFTDIVGSTEKAATLGDAAWKDLLDQHHSSIRKELERFAGVELDTAGDGFFASFDGPGRAIHCACAISKGVRELGLEVRAGLHTGECELLDGKVGGIAVHIGARVASQAQAGEVLVSNTVKDLVAGSGLEFEERGAAQLKGVPGEWGLYAVSTNT
jgi:class 3 adenylate cyclase